jgi:hypothetical protein
MSNPLLKPNDPRFQQPAVRDSDGQNRFSDSAPKAAAPAGRDVYAPAASDDERPFAPEYTAQQRPRFQLLLVLGALGWLAAVVGAVSLTGIFDIGWLAPLLGIGPAAAGWLLAYEDLKAIRVGAIAAAARQPTRHAFWLGLTALIACLGIVAAMIFQQMHFLPDVL